MPTRTPRGVCPQRLLPLSVAVSALCAMGAASAQSAAEPVAELREVVVSASGFEQDIKEAPASITVITRKELEQKRFSSLAQALEDVEGVDIGAATDKTGGLNIGIRGMPSDYTLVLIDGRRQNSAGNVTPNDFGGTQTSFLPPLSAIERIEVIRGPMSTLYGSDAMGGVINIITRKVGKTWTGSVGADYTLQEESAFGDTRSARFYLSGPIKEDLVGLALRGSAFRRNAADVTYVGANGQLVIPSMGANPVKSDVDTLGARLSITPNRYHDIVLDVDTGRQTYDNSRGQMGTLGTGGYAPEQKYNRDQWSIAHTGRYGFGTWDTSYMVNSTETIGRTIPPARRAPWPAARARWRSRARCSTPSWSPPGATTSPPWAASGGRPRWKTAWRPASSSSRRRPCSSRTSGAWWIPSSSPWARATTATASSAARPARASTACGTPHRSGR